MLGQVSRRIDQLKEGNLYITPRYLTVRKKLRRRQKETSSGTIRTLANSSIREPSVTAVGLPFLDHEQIRCL
jgi:hypothetical protein